MRKLSRTLTIAALLAASTPALADEPAAVLTFRAPPMVFVVPSASPQDGVTQATNIVRACATGVLREYSAESEETRQAVFRRCVTNGSRGIITVMSSPAPCTVSAADPTFAVCMFADVSATVTMTPVQPPAASTPPVSGPRPRATGDVVAFAPSQW